MESSRQICLMLLVSNHWCFDMCVFVRVWVSEKINLTSTVEKVISSCDFALLLIKEWWDSFIISSFSFRLLTSASILRAENKTQKTVDKKN